MRFWELKQKEVININTCRRMGYVGDLEFDPVTGCITAIIIPGPACLWGFLGREREFVIPFCDICQLGGELSDAADADDVSARSLDVGAHTV